MPRVRRLLLRVAAAALVAIGVPLVWYAPASAVAPDDKGWWFKGDVGDPTGVLAGAGLKIAPPNVPEDGLYVANDPTGPAGVSALRFHFADASAVSLTLKVASGSAGLEAAVVACPGTSSWIAADGGAWDRRPESDCDTAQIAGDAAEDGTTMTWQIPDTFASGSAYNVILLPDPTTREPFQIPFEPPDDSAITPVKPGAGSSPAAPPSDFSAEDFGTTSAPPSTVADAPSSAAGSDFETPPAVPSTPDNRAASAAPPVSGRQRQVPLATVTRSVSATDPERWVATGVLVAIGIGMWILSGRQVPTPGLVGGLRRGTAPGQAPRLPDGGANA